MSFKIGDKIVRVASQENDVYYEVIEEYMGYWVVSPKLYGETFDIAKNQVHWWKLMSAPTSPTPVSVAPVYYDPDYTSGSITVKADESASPTIYIGKKVRHKSWKQDQYVTVKWTDGKFFVGQSDDCDPDLYDYVDDWEAWKPQPVESQEYIPEDVIYVVTFKSSPGVYIYRDINAAVECYDQMVKAGIGIVVAQISLNNLEDFSGPLPMDPLDHEVLKTVRDSNYQAKNSLTATNKG